MVWCQASGDGTIAYEGITGMIIIGLTGSIATGKTFVGRCFEKLGVPVFNADEEVHVLLEIAGKAVQPVAKLFPNTYRCGEIDRQKLGHIVFNDLKKLKQLEKIIHPLVKEEQAAFLRKAQEENNRFAVLEVPLLFESEVDKLCDYIVVTTVDPKTQEERALKREGMTKERFKQINKEQMADAKKRKKADYVMDTTESEFSVFRQVKKILKELAEQS